MWRATGNMNEVRFGETATLLRNGNVLVVGGRSNWGGHGVALASAELFDPSTGRWTLTGSMLEARQEHAAILLANGKVLVLGGNASGGGIPRVLFTAELFDPSTGTWTKTGRVPLRVLDATATLLPDGKVLVLGGRTSNADDPVRGAEIYDPVSEAWTETTSMDVGRQGHTATLLGDGRVLVVGGGCCDQPARASAEVYDPESATWVRTGGLSSPRLYHAAVLLADGQVLVYGGDNRSDHPPVTTAELYDPATGVWVTTGSPRNAGSFEAQGAVHGQGVRLADGRIFAAAYAAAGEMYDPARGSWSTVGGLSGDAYLYVHTSTLLVDGRVLVTSEPASVVFDANGAP